MNFTMSPEIEAVRDMMNRFMQNEVVPVMADHGEDALGYNLVDRHHRKTGLRDMRKGEVALAATDASA